jgi:1-acyl-sn-glycerol-3-phosphate acyltransferase
MSENGHRPLCEALTKTGQRCRLPAQEGSRYCYRHRHLETVGEVAVTADEEAQNVAVAPPTAPAAADIPAPAAPAPGATLLTSLREGLERLLATAPTEVREWLNERISPEWFDPQTWQGLAYVLQVALQMQIEFLQRRLRGEYEVDPWGYDQEVADYLALVTGFLFNRYWRVEINGLEHIPNEGRALLVANHSGVLPLDGAVIAYGVREQHPAHRLVRVLMDDWFLTLPFVSILLTKSGHVPAHPDNGRRLLEADEVVLAFAASQKGISPFYRERYRLGRFGRGGFVKMAVETGAPILPVAVVGVEETYPLVVDLKPVAQWLGAPAFPVPLTLPWLGPLALLPLPTRWTLDIGEPIVAHLEDVSLVDNPAFVSDITDLVRNRVQEWIDKRLAERRSWFR